jgi:hypothetical protein
MTNEISCEVPNSDAHRVFCSFAEVRRFLASHNVTIFHIVKDHADRPLVHVPAFAKSRDRFAAFKAEDCGRWGCE